VIDHVDCLLSVYVLVIKEVRVTSQDYVERVV